MNPRFVLLQLAMVLFSLNSEGDAQNIDPKDADYRRLGLNPEVWYQGTESLIKNEYFTQFRYELEHWTSCKWVNASRLQVLDTNFFKKSITLVLFEIDGTSVYSFAVLKYLHVAYIGECGIDESVAKTTAQEYVQKNHDKLKPIWMSSKYANVWDSKTDLGKCISMHIYELTYSPLRPLIIDICERQIKEVRGFQFTVTAPISDKQFFMVYKSGMQNTLENSEFAVHNYLLGPTTNTNKVTFRDNSNAFWFDNWMEASMIFGSDPLRFSVDFQTLQHVEAFRDSMTIEGIGLAQINLPPTLKFLISSFHYYWIIVSVTNTKTQERKVYCTLINVKNDEYLGIIKSVGVTLIEDISGVKDAAKREEIMERNDDKILTKIYTFSSKLFKAWQNE